MQAAENSKVSLQAIDGGLARASVRMLAGAAAAEDADFTDAVRALRRVLDAFDTGLALDPAPVVRGRGYDAGLRVPGVMPAGSPTLVGRRVRAFAPAIKARTRELDLFVMSSQGADAVAEPATVAAAAAFAERFGRERLCVVTGPAVDPAAADESAAACGLALEFRDVAEVCGALAGGAATFDALLVPDTFFDTVSSVAASVAGSTCLVTECASHEAALVVSAGLAGASALPAFPGLVLAVSELLGILGRVEAGSRIADAWCRAVESGVHTADFEVTYPYARLVDESGFADAVIERMGETPRALRRHLDGMPARRYGTKPARPAMRVIQGGR